MKLRELIFMGAVLLTVDKSAADVIQNQRTVKFDYTLYGDVLDKNEIDGVTVDKDGNTILGGPYQHRAKFNYDTRNEKERTSKNGTDIYVTKISANGKRTLWFKEFDSGENDFMYDLTVDKNGDILISGSIGGKISQKHGVVEKAPDGSPYIAKLSGKTGDLIWKTYFKDIPGGANEVAVDKNGNVIATIMGISKEFNFDKDHQFKGSGKKDAFILKLDSKGKIKWVYPFTGYGNKQLRAIGVNKENKIIFGFEYIGYNTFLSEDNKTNKTYSSEIKVFQGLMGVLSPKGKLLFDRPIWSKGFSNVRGAGADSKGNFYFTGVLTGQALFGSKDVMASKNQSSYLAKVDPSGNLKWLSLTHGDGKDMGAELIVTHDDRIVLTNSTTSSLYHVFNSEGEILQQNISKAGNNKKARAVVTIYNTKGKVIETYSPEYSNGSLAGVLEDSKADNCLAVQFRFRDQFVHPNSSPVILNDKKDNAIQVSKLFPLK
jgi:hypothetical protein